MHSATLFLNGLYLGYGQTDSVQLKYHILTRAIDLSGIFNNVSQYDKISIFTLSSPLALGNS